MFSLDDQIRDYLNKGWKVIPLHYPLPSGKCSCGNENCPSIGKHPTITWKGIGDQPQDIEEVIKWWKDDPEYNIGILTGKQSGIVVIDVDGPEGIESLGKFDCPETPTVLTGKGKHLYYAYPGLPIKNAVRLLPGIDIRGDAGYVVAPPSGHMNGRQYKWYGNTQNIPLAPLPSWVNQLLNRESSKTEANRPDHPTVREGGRNNRLTSIAGTLRQKGAEFDEIRENLLQTNEKICDPPLPYCEIENIVKSICKYPSGRLGQDQKNRSITSLVKGFTPSKDSRLESICGLFLKGGVSLIAGYPGAGKTIFLLDLASRLSLGQETLDILDEPKKQSVLFVEGDIIREIMYDRARLLDLSANNSRLKLLALHDVITAGLELDLSSRHSSVQIMELVQHINPDLIILDSLASLHSGDENDNKAMRKVMMSLLDLANNTGAAIVAVHHLRKVKRSERGIPVSQDDIIGASMFSRLATAAYGIDIQIKVDGDEIRTLKSLKNSIGPPISFSFKFVPYLNEKGEDRMRVEYLPNTVLDNTKKERALRILRTNFEGKTFTRSSFSEIAEISDAYAKKILQFLREQNRLTMEGHGKDTRYTLRWGI